MPEVVIIGGDWIGLKIAYNLLKETDVKPIILEKTGEVGMAASDVSLSIKLIRLFQPVVERHLLASSKELAQQVQKMGGKIFLHQRIYSVYSVRGEVCSLHTIDDQTGELTLFKADYFLSSSAFHEVIHPLTDATSKFKNMYLLHYKRGERRHHILDNQDKNGKS